MNPYNDDFEHVKIYFRNINLRQTGKDIAVFGPQGTGKSTFIIQVCQNDRLIDGRIRSLDESLGMIAFISSYTDEKKKRICLWLDDQDQEEGFQFQKMQNHHKLYEFTCFYECHKPLKLPTGFNRIELPYFTHQEISKLKTQPVFMLLSQIGHNQYVLAGDVKKVKDQKLNYMYEPSNIEFGKYCQMYATCIDDIDGACLRFDTATDVPYPNSEHIRSLFQLLFFDPKTKNPLPIFYTGRNKKRIPDTPETELSVALNKDFAEYTVVRSDDDACDMY